MIKIALESQDETRWIGVLLGSGTALEIDAPQDEPLSEQPLIEQQ